MTLWVAPGKNGPFAKAIRENKVLTIHSTPVGHKKDYGQIGFHKKQGAIYMVFPKRLPKDPISRIVGINYQLAEEPESKEPRSLRTIGLNKTERPPPPPRPAKPEWKQFEVVVRRTAILEDAELVKAKNETEARELALRAINGKPFEVNRAISRVEVRGVTTRGKSATINKV
jgi:hypothetical protein